MDNDDNGNGNGHSIACGGGDDEELLLSPAALEAAAAGASAPPAGDTDAAAAEGITAPFTHHHDAGQQPQGHRHQYPEPAPERGPPREEGLLPAAGEGAGGTAGSGAGDASVAAAVLDFTASNSNTSNEEGPKHDSLPLGQGQGDNDNGQEEQKEEGGKGKDDADFAEEKGAEGGCGGDDGEAPPSKKAEGEGGGSAVLGGAPQRKRYSNHVKLQVLEALKRGNDDGGAPGGNVVARVSREFGIATSCVRRWKKESAQISRAATALSRGTAKCSRPYDPLSRLSSVLTELRDWTERVQIGPHYCYRYRRNRKKRCVRRRGAAAASSLNLASPTVLVPITLQVKELLLQLDAECPRLSEKERTALESFSASVSWAKKFARTRQWTSSKKTKGGGGGGTPSSSAFSGASSSSLSPGAMARQYAARMAEIREIVNPADKEELYPPHRVYVMDESILFYRVLPNSCYVSGGGDDAATSTTMNAAVAADKDSTEVVVERKDRSDGHVAGSDKVADGGDHPLEEEEEEEEGKQKTTPLVRARFLESRDRISLLVCVNEDGSDKLPVAILSNDTKSDHASFVHARQVTLPLYQADSANAMASSSLHSAGSSNRYLLNWWNMFLAQIRSTTSEKVLLLCPRSQHANALVDPLMQVRVEWLPAPPPAASSSSSSSPHHPCHPIRDARVGIAARLRRYYRCVYLLQLLQLRDEVEERRERAAEAGIPEPTRGIEEGCMPHLRNAMTLILNLWNDSIDQPLVADAFVRSGIRYAIGATATERAKPAAASGTTDDAAAATATSTDNATTNAVLPPVWDEKKSGKKRGRNAMSSNAAGAMMNFRDEVGVNLMRQLMIEVDEFRKTSVPAAWKGEGGKADGDALEKCLVDLHETLAKLPNDQRAPFKQLLEDWITLEEKDVIIELLQDELLQGQQDVNQMIERLVRRALGAAPQAAPATTALDARQPTAQSTAAAAAAATHTNMREIRKHVQSMLEASAHLSNLTSPEYREVAVTLRECVEKIRQTARQERENQPVDAAAGPVDNGSTRDEVTGTPMPGGVAV